MTKAKTLADTVSTGGPLATPGEVNLPGGAQGSVPYQSAAGVTALLAPGTSGQVLTSGGAGANPTWAAAVTAPAGSTGQVQYNNAGAFGAISSGTSGQVLTSAGAGAAPTWADAAAPSAGKLLASGNVNSSTGYVTLSWANTGIKRLQVYLGGASTGGAGQIYINVGDTTSVVTASNYRIQITEFDFATIATASTAANANWRLTSASSTSWPVQMIAEFGLTTSNLPSMVARFGRVGSPENTLAIGDFNGTWNNARFQSIQVQLTGGAPYDGRLTVIGYTE